MEDLRLHGLFGKQRFELADFPLDLREGLDILNGNTHDRASSVMAELWFAKRSAVNPLRTKKQP